MIWFMTSGGTGGILPGAVIVEAGGFGGMIAAGGRTEFNSVGHSGMPVVGNTMAYKPTALQAPKNMFSVGGDPLIDQATEAN